MIEHWKYIFGPVHTYKFYSKYIIEYIDSRTNSSIDGRTCFSAIKASPVSATARKNIMIIIIPGAINSVKFGLAEP